MTGINRRTFFGLTLTGVASTAMLIATARPTVTVVVVSGSDHDMEHGFNVSSAEVRRMASLLGIEWREIVVAADRVPSTEMSRAAQAFVTLAPVSRWSNVGGTQNVPVVSALPLQPGSPPHLFSVRASARSRRQAEAEWQRRRPGATVKAVEWHRSLGRFGAEQLNARFSKDTTRQPSASTWAGWMAVKVVAEALLRSKDVGVDPAGIRSLAYDGHKGMPLRFDSRDRHLLQPLYLVGSDNTVVGTINPDEIES